ncbi:hypothetical protein RhiirA1_465190 [Rhizophagus irregularis]|uniref:Uncharacterized protein n=1 Tax=Rhizophagus irregularis TaxID=588596 RepID=A0A2N0RGH1_9GLOM|nr:hypothetical protein RhiirA1_465190 [Rhizophagus irregularis]
MIIFLIDTGSSVTYISEEVLRSFRIELADPLNDSIHVSINNKGAWVKMSHAHFKDICILGMSFLTSNKVGLHAFSNIFHYFKNLLLSITLISGEGEQVDAMIKETSLKTPRTSLTLTCLSSSSEALSANLRFFSSRFQIYFLRISIVNDSMEYSSFSIEILSLRGIEKIVPLPKT